MKVQLQPPNRGLMGGTSIGRITRLCILRKRYGRMSLSLWRFLNGKR